MPTTNRWFRHPGLWRSGRKCGRCNRMRILAVAVIGMCWVIDLRHIPYHLIHSLTLVSIVCHVRIHLQPFSTKRLNDLSIHRQVDMINQVVSNIRNPLKLISNRVRTCIIACWGYSSVQILERRPNVWKRQYKIRVME